MAELTKEVVNEWYALMIQVKNGYHMSKWDKSNLIRLNHIIMEASHKVHNDTMLDKDW